MQIPTTVFAQTQDAFNLSGIIDNIINYQSKEGDIYENENSKDKFLYAIENLNNGNVVVAYSEFQNTIDLLNDNLALFMLSKKLYEIGFFSLGDIAISKISNKNAMKNQIETLKATYKPLYTLTKDEESYLAKTYATIYFNNAPEEAAFNLIKKTILLENSDYANFIMAQCMYECKQYNQALIYVNKAIEKNPDNSCYKLFKLKTLVAFKKYKGNKIY